MSLNNPLEASEFEKDMVITHENRDFDVETVLTLDEFEGLEKRIEVSFVPMTKPPGANGLRVLDRDVWDKVIGECQCSIIHEDHFESYDAYVLSESSLFVFVDRVIIKTCGRSVPFQCLKTLTTIAENRVGLKAERLMYSHGSWMFPVNQPYPHFSVNEEVCLFNSCFFSDWSFENNLFRNLERNSESAS